MSDAGDAGVSPGSVVSLLPVRVPPVPADEDADSGAALSLAEPPPEPPPVQSAAGALRAVPAGPVLAARRLPGRAGAGLLRLLPGVREPRGPALRPREPERVLRAVWERTAV